MSPRMAYLLPALLIILAAAPASAAPVPDPAQPTAAAAVLIADGAILSWLPSAVPADSYEVYGVTNGVLSPLGSVGADHLTAAVPAGFGGYAVTAWHAGTESQPTNATLRVAGSGPCVSVYQTIPPSVFIGNCLTGVAQVLFDAPPILRVW